MKYYIGLDVSLKQTSICVVNQTGSVVREGVVDSDPEMIATFVRSKAPDAIRVGLEHGEMLDRRKPINSAVPLELILRIADDRAPVSEIGNRIIALEG